MKSLPLNRTEALRELREARDLNADLLAALKRLMTPCPPGTHTIGPDGKCPECPVEKQALAAIARAGEYYASTAKDTRYTDAVGAPSDGS